jgi:hypothetical protein
MPISRLFINIFRLESPSFQKNDISCVVNSRSHTMEMFS